MSIFVVSVFRCIFYICILYICCCCYVISYSVGISACDHWVRAAQPDNLMPPISEFWAAGRHKMPVGYRGSGLTQVSWTRDHVARKRWYWEHGRSQTLHQGHHSVCEEQRSGASSGVAAWNGYEMTRDKSPELQLSHRCVSEGPAMVGVTGLTEVGAQYKSWISPATVQPSTHARWGRSGCRPWSPWGRCPAEADVGP